MIRNGVHVKGKEHIALIMQDSTCEVVEYGEGAVQIEFTGLAARIPSLKNSKIPGTNFINPDTRNRLRAMQKLFLIAGLRYGKPIQRRTERQLMLVRFFNCRGDDDNSIAAIKDWLQPAITTAPWGIGLIENDRLISGWPIRHDWVNDTKEDRTIINLIPFSSALKNKQITVSFKI